MLTMDSRGWISLGCYVLVLVLLGMMWADKDLLNNDFFKTIATAIILTGWNGGPVGWAFQATKTGTEAAASSARIAENAAGLPAQPTIEPQPVTVVNAPSQPVPTTTETST